MAIYSHQARPKKPRFKKSIDITIKNSLGIRNQKLLRIQKEVRKSEAIAKIRSYCENQKLLRIQKEVRIRNQKHISLIVFVDFRRELEGI
ncbi:hypothetical protein LXL04_036350 [Taraxacum kok-saghyz]